MKQSYKLTEKRTLFACVLGATLLTAGAAQAQTVKYEAEDPKNTLAGGAAVLNDITGASGTGYVDFNGNNGLSVSFPITATTAGAYSLVIRYQSKFGTTQPGYAKIGSYKVNDGPVNKVYLNGTAPGIAGPAFRSTSNLLVNLKVGDNTIVIGDNGFGYFGVDFISLTPQAAGAALTPDASGRVEAELGQLSGTQALVRDDDTTPHSKSSYVSSFSEVKAVGSAIILPVTIATAGLYQIAVGARGQFDDKQLDVAVTTGNSTGGKLTTSLGAASADFKSVVVGKYNLTAGVNTITITSQTGYLDVDYVDVTATTGEATAAKASAEAQKALSAYPNPTNGQSLNVRLEATAARHATFELVNALGQRVLSTDRRLKAGANQFQLATDRVAGGLYQLVVRGGNQPLLVRRVVIN